MKWKSGTDSLHPTSATYIERTVIQFNFNFFALKIKKYMHEIMLIIEIYVVSSEGYPPTPTARSELNSDSK